MKTTSKKLRRNNDGRVLTSLKTLYESFVRAGWRGVRSSVGGFQLQEDTKNDTRIIEKSHLVETMRFIHAVSIQ